MNNIIVIFINDNYTTQANSIIIQFIKLNIHNYLFICMDNTSYVNLNTHNKILKKIELDGSWKGKQELWIKRTEIIYDLLITSNLDILHCDADAVWLKNPLSLYSDHKIDMYFTPGLTYPNKTFKEWGFVVRGGFYYLRNNTFVKKFVRSWVDYTHNYRDDQIALNSLLKDKKIQWHIPINQHYIYNYIHSDQKPYDILYCKDIIYGKLDEHEIAVLSAFDFPRLLTQDAEPYVMDLYNKSEYVLS